MTEDKEPKRVRGMTSDVSSDAVEHEKMVHEWVEQHPQWKRQHVEDKPKARNKCNDCAGFRTTFCTWNTADGPSVKEDDDACSNFFPRPHVVTKSEKKFLKKVEELE